MLRTIAIGFAVIALAAAGAEGAIAQDSDIFVIPSGYGEIALDDGSFRCASADLASTGCILNRPIGSTLTFTAAPEPVTGPEPGTDPDPNPPVQSSFVGWSRPECEGTGPCTITVDDNPDAIAAHFTPVWLEVLVNGVGTVTADGATVASPDCPDGRCIIGLFQTGTRVSVTATPTQEPLTTGWGFGCDPFDSDLLAGRCVIEMANIRNFVSVGFQGQTPSAQPPYNLSKPVIVKRAGSGEGRVEGSGTDAEGISWRIDCGSDCKLTGIQYQTRVRLRAIEASGSTFERWAGPPCGGQTVCTFTAGKYPTVRAAFSRNASASASSASSSSSSSDPGPGPGSDPGPGPGSAPFSVSVSRATASGRRAKRRIVVTLTTNRSARATLRLTRKGRRVTSRTFALPAGTRTLTAKVPRGTRAGWYRLSLDVTAADGTRKSFSKRLQLRR
jgi:hypothetical protein